MHCIFSPVGIFIETLTKSTEYVIINEPTSAPVPIVGNIRSSVFFQIPERMSFYGGYMKRSFLAGLTVFEFFLWLGSVGLILISYLVFSPPDPVVLLATLIGTTALIYVAKGLPVGQVLIIVFALLYGFVSWRFRYYGEMITYLGMSAPMALAATVSWLRNPFEKGKAQVKVRSIDRKNFVVILLLTSAVTVLFGWLLWLLDTPNLFWSIFSVFTSFAAASLTYLRSPFYALAYAVNDLALIVLWVLATLEDLSYLPMVTCFFVFLVNDGYAFFNWSRMRRRQAAAETKLREGNAAE